MWNFYKDRWFWLSARLIMAGILLFTVVFKIADINGFINSVIEYGFIPVGPSRFVGWVFPIWELFVGCAMILGVFVRPTQVFVIPTMAGFAFINTYEIIIANTTEFVIRCGCLGSLINIPHEVSLTLDLLTLLFSLVLVTQKGKDFLVLGGVVNKINPAFHIKRRPLFNASLVASVLLLMAVFTAFNLAMAPPLKVFSLVTPVAGLLLVAAFTAAIIFLVMAFFVWAGKWPDALKGELEWIISSHILCIEHTQSCELRRTDADTCVFHTKMLRKFRNISHSTESLVIGGSLNEWCYHPGTSKIISFGYTKLGKNNEIKETVKKEGGITSIKEQSVPMVPNEEITVWFESEEAVRTNDEQIWVFGCPTMNPVVTVKAFEGASSAVNFGYRSPAELIGLGTHRLKGTLLPGQAIAVRWWANPKTGE